MLSAHVTPNQGQTLFPSLRIPPDFMPNGKKSLAGISEHALGLGIVLGFSISITGQLLTIQHALWRLPAFVTILSIFHFLEFDMTARFNPTDAKVSSYLIFNNGRAYNIAHTVAMIELVITYWLGWGEYAWTSHVPIFGPILQEHPAAISPVLGTVLILVGQTFRSLAMKQAGSSFNHLVQSTKKDNHVLVKSGVYAVSRHPAYFGFFWWGLGTQLLLGNTICLFGYAVVLWKFFAHRIMHEEKHLVNFFGDNYKQYRRETSVLIPFIR